MIPEPVRAADLPVLDDHDAAPTRRRSAPHEAADRARGVERAADLEAGDLAYELAADLDGAPGMSALVRFRPRGERSVLWPIVIAPPRPVANS